MNSWHTARLDNTGLVKTSAGQEPDLRAMWLGGLSLTAIAKAVVDATGFPSVGPSP